MGWGLEKMFSFIDNSEAWGRQGELFELGGETLRASREYTQEEIEFVFGIFSKEFDPCVLCDGARKLFDASVEAFYTFVHAWLSEEAVESEMLSFARKVIADPKAALDRGNEETCIVLEAENRVLREIDRMHGILRFSPDPEEVYIARCEPDHFVLPALGGYFTARYADSASWAIIDEKRGLVLSRKPGGFARICRVDGSHEKPENAEKDPWEELWKHYHKTINNESRKNLSLQRQFLPNRYRKYLPETRND
jgi:probable DNA metabolism protein